MKRCGVPDLRLWPGLAAGEGPDVSGISGELATAPDQWRLLAVAAGYRCAVAIAPNIAMLSEW